MSAQTARIVAADAEGGTRMSRPCGTAAISAGQEDCDTEAITDILRGGQRP